MPGPTQTGGPANVVSPEPSRSVEPILDGAAPIDPNQLTPGVSDPLHQTILQTAPSPADPEGASELAEYKKRLGEALRSMGDLKAGFKTQIDNALAEQSLKYDMAVAGMAATNPQASPTTAPTNYDPEATPTWAEMALVLDKIPQVVAAQAIQATWDVTQAEYNAVMIANPGLQNTPEPQRTQLIQRAVNLERSKASTYAPQGNLPPQSQPGMSATPPLQTRDLDPNTVVPHVESGGGQMPVLDPTAPINELQTQAQAEYAAAAKLKNPRERFPAMRRAWQKSLQAQGVTLNDLAGASFSVGNASIESK